MLSAARDSKTSPDTGDLLLQIQLVAGARNHWIWHFRGPWSNYPQPADASGFSESAAQRRNFIRRTGKFTPTARVGLNPIP